MNVHCLLILRDIHVDHDKDNRLIFTLMYEHQFFFSFPLELDWGQTIPCVRGNYIL